MILNACHSWTTPSSSHIRPTDTRPRVRWWLRSVYTRAKKSSRQYLFGSSIVSKQKGAEWSGAGARRLTLRRIDDLHRCKGDELPGFHMVLTIVVPCGWRPGAPTLVSLGLAGRASGAAGLSADYLAALLDTFDRALTPREVVQSFYKNPSFPLVPSTDDIRRAIYDLLYEAWELVDADGNLLAIASPGQISINSIQQTLRRRVGMAGSPAITGTSTIAETGGLFGGDRQLGGGHAR